MAIVNGSLQEGYKDAAWFAANPTLVLLVGQKVNLEQTGTYKLGDGTTQLSALSFLGGSGSGLSGLTTNKVLKATSATTAGDSNITDDGTTVSINTKTSITQNTTGTGSKGLSVNFNTIGEVFYIDDNGELIYNANAGATFKGSNGIINVISNGGVNPYIIFKYANGANTSGYLSGDGNSLVIDTAALKVNHLTASELTATDSSKKLVSLPVATYPSLTELSYVKGVTSALQTQLDGKVNIADRKGTDYFLKTGATTFDSRYSTNATAFTSTTNLIGKDAMVAFPFIIEETMTFDRIGAEITTAVASGVCSLLIYDSVNNVPTNLVLDAGTISLTSATYQEITINKQLTAGLYFLVLWHNGSSTPAFRAMPITACNKVLGLPSTLGAISSYTRIYNSKVYTSAPLIYDTTGITVYSSNNPIISLRRSA